VRAPRGSSFRNAEARRRSGAKQSRTARRIRYERRALLRGRRDEPTEKRFGILLKEAVAKQLARLGVPHTLYDFKGDYARAERVELAILNRDGSTTIMEIDWTLRRGVRGKITDFVRAATMRDDWSVPRVYLEIEDRVGFALKPMAERVAHAIREITSGLDRFLKRIEQGNVIGLALVLDHERKAELIPMRLMRMIGSRARDWLEGLLIAREAEEELRARKSPATTRPLPHQTATAPTRHAPHFWRAFIREVAFHTGFTPNPTPVYAQAQRNHPLRMPYRR